jgi:hypothetical protein
VVQCSSFHDQFTIREIRHGTRQSSWHTALAALHACALEGAGILMRGGSRAHFFFGAAFLDAFCFFGAAFFLAAFCFFGAVFFLAAVCFFGEAFFLAASRFFGAAFCLAASSFISAALFSICQRPPRAQPGPKAAP